MDGPDLSLHAGVPGCEIACLILSSISLSVTTKLQLHPPHQTSQIDAAHWCAVRQIHGLSNTPPTHKEWWVRDSAWNGGKTHTHTHICAHQFLKRITQSGAKRETFFLVVVPSFSPGLLPSFSLYSHPWHVMIKWVLLEFSGWPGLWEAAIPSHPPSSNLHSFYHFIPPSPLHHLTSFSPSTNPTISLPLGTDSFRIIHLYVSNPAPQLIPLCSARYDNWLAERVMAKWKCGHKHEMKTWVIHKKKSILNRCQEEDEHLDFTT